MTGDVRSVEDRVFLHSSAATDSIRDTLSGLGVNILDPRIPSGFLDRQAPKSTNSLSSASDLLSILGTISIPNVSDDVADILRAHLASCLMDTVRLNDAQKAALRELPIHLVLTVNAQTRPGRLPANHVLRCVLSSAFIALPLPSLPNMTFVRCTADEVSMSDTSSRNLTTMLLCSPPLLAVFCNFTSVISPNRSPKHAWRF